MSYGSIPSHVAQHGEKMAKFLSLGDSLWNRWAASVVKDKSYVVDKNRLGWSWENFTPLSVKEKLYISGAVLGMIEGIYQLSISAKGVMPKNYAAKTVMKLLEPYLQ